MLNVRADYEISPNQHLFGRWSQEWNLLTSQGCSNASETNCYDGDFPRHAAVFGHTWNPTPTLVNEARFQLPLTSSGLQELRTLRAWAYSRRRDSAIFRS